MHSIHDWFVASLEEEGAKKRPVVDTENSFPEGCCEE